MAETINASQYEELSQNMNKPVVLEFGADW